MTQRPMSPTPAIPDLRERFDALPVPRMCDRLRLCPGTAGDYASLAEHHYRAARPATMTRVFTLHDPSPTVADRFLGRDAPASATGRPVAVLVESLPSLSCRLRDAALFERYALLPARQRARLLNAEVRCISRVIVDPRYRGLGLAVRLVRHALATATTPYTEALAAMGVASPFFEKAGMAAYQRPPHPHDERLAAALSACGTPGHALLRVSTWDRVLQSIDAERRGWLTRELARWYRSAIGRSAGSSRDPADHFRAAQHKLRSRPVYYLYANPGVVAG